MATKPKTAPKQEFVTKEEFNRLENSIGSLIEVVKASVQKTEETATAVATVAKEAADAKAAAPITPLEKEIIKARPDFVENVNPEWIEHAKEIIGDALDHVEVKTLRTGGLLFTVVIKTEHSNAPENYLKEHKSDRRTKEIGSEGIGGVDAWCKLIKQNLSRPRENRMALT